MTISYTMKLKYMTPQEFWLFRRFGRMIEPLEDVDFCKN